MRIAEYIGNSSERFKILMHLFLDSKYRLTQRAPRVLSRFAGQHPDLIQPYLAELVYNLQKTKLNAVKRNIVRMLQNIQVPEESQGTLVDHCFKYLGADEPIAVKVFAMTLLANLA